MILFDNFKSALCQESKTEVWCFFRDRQQHVLIKWTLRYNYDNNDSNINDNNNDKNFSFRNKLMEVKVNQKNLPLVIYKNHNIFQIE